MNSNTAHASAQSDADLSFLSDHIQLVAIYDGKPIAYYFGSDRIAAQIWADALNAQHYNIYWSVNIVRAGLNKKAAKADIVGVRYFHTDLDNTQDLAAAQRWRPSIIINSGGGFNMLWKVAGPTTVDVAEDINRRIEHALKADHCHNIDRVLRVPGTINWPTPAKIERGRNVSFATLAQSDNGAVHTVDAMAKEFPPVPVEARQTSGEAEVGPWVPLRLDEVPMAPQLRAMCEREAATGERSEHVSKCCSTLGREGFSNEIVMGLLMHPDNSGLHPHIADQPDKERAARRKVAIAESHRPGRIFGDTPAILPPGVMTEAPIILPAPRKSVAVIDQSTGTISVDFSEDFLALVFAERYAPCLKYVARWGTWLEWQSYRWIREETYKAFDLAREICRIAATAAGMEPSQAKALAKANTVSAVERLARTDRRMAMTHEQFDPDPWLLATPEGVVDLKTGVLQAPRPENYNTKATAVGPALSADCPLWLNFLATIFAEDVDLIAFIRRLIGYSLTGVIREHILAFGYGTGGNGKGVFLNTLTSVLGDYAVVAPAEVFQESRHDRHSTELARLQGARFVTAQETEEGRRWAESRIKALTGGDPVTARFMRQDDFTYTPQFKLFIVGNHKPGLRGVDEAIRRRLHLIPFSVTVPKAQRDPELQEKLKAEWPGILRWAINGCLEWQRIGLQPPKSVLDATDEYLSEEDAIARWLLECCQLDPAARSQSSMLWDSYRAWATFAGEFAGTQKRFSQTLEDRGFQKDHDRNGNYFIGLALLQKNSMISETVTDVTGSPLSGV